MTRAYALTLALALVACGPAVGDVGDDAGTTGASESGVADGAASNSSTGGPPPTGDADSTGLADTSTGEADEGGSFLGEADLGADAGCDLYAQNCPPGEKCMPWSSDGGATWNATRCSPIADDPKQVAETCMVEGSGVSGIDDCDLGLMCWNVDANGIGYCEDLCVGSPQQPICTTPDDFCMVSDGSVMSLCVAQCDPLAQDCEIVGQACYPWGENWHCAFEIDREPDRGSTPCEYANACAGGTVCLYAAAFSACSGSVGCCSLLCDLFDESSNAMCQALDPAQTCEPWYAEGHAPFGYESVGVCMIAP